jgi:hypothetical protein
MVHVEKLTEADFRLTFGWFGALPMIVGQSLREEMVVRNHHQTVLPCHSEPIPSVTALRQVASLHWG